MSAFGRGFQLGGDMYDSAERNRLLAAREAREAKESDQRLIEGGLRTDALRRAAGREAEQDRVLFEMRDFTQGINRPQTNAALDADFEAADQASLRGLAMPAMRGGSNLANEQALTVRAPVDVNSPEFRSGMAGLRQRYALSKGDMVDYDRVVEAERKRITDKDDADFVMALQKDPNGDIAKQARTFINEKSRSLTVDTDPKTGVSTFRVVKGDGTKPINVSPSDLGKIAVGYRRLERGDIGGLDVISAVNKDLAEAAAKELGVDLQVGTANNTAIHQRNQDTSARITANAAATNAKTNSDLRGEQIRALQTLREGREEALQIMEAFDKLTPEQQVGPEGQALVQRFNTINVRAGGTVGLQPKAGAGQRGNILKTPVEQKKNDDGTYTAFAKDGGHALYNTINGEPIPLGMTSDEYAGFKKAAQQSGVKLVAGEENGRLVLRFQGADGQFYADPQQAKYAKAKEEPKATGGIDTSRRPSAGAVAPGTISVSVNPQTKQKTYTVEGVRGRFTSREDAEAAAAKAGSSPMSRSMNRYGD